MLRQLLNIIAPDDCLECGVEGTIWCDWCRLQHEPLPSRCFRCHAVTRDFAVCRSCKSSMRLSNVQVSAEYEGTAKRLIARLKFDCNRQVVSVLAKTMVDNLPFFGEETLVVPVPTAPARVRQRGFDHTLLLAKEIAKHRNLTFAKPVVRTDNNRQVGADRKIRIAQAKGSYRIRGNTAIQDKHIILIDDIVTTGATLRAVSQILKDAGAASVYAAVFAYSS